MATDEAGQAAQLGALLDQYRREVNLPRLLRRPAPVSMALLGAVVVLHALMIGAGALLGERLGDKGAVLAFGAKINALVFAGEWWRLVSAMFLHGGLLHLAFNGWALYVLGPLLERLYGSRRFLVLYVATGIASELASAFFTDGPSVGASGALFGLLGALIVFGIKFRGALPPAVARRLGVGMVPWVVINLAIGFIPGLPFDNAAHIGGLLAGVLLALGMSSPLVGEGGRLRRWGLDALFFASCVALTWGLVFMFRQAALCGASAEAFARCQP